MMIENLPSELWLFIAYATGTVFGLWMGYRSRAETIIEMTIDSLIEQGYLRSRKDSKGDIELLKPITFEE